MKLFRAPTKSLGGLDAKAVAALLAASADVTLILDRTGVVRDMALASDALREEFDGEPGWLGKPWASSVMEDSRTKVEELVRDAASGAAPRWRHVNQRNRKDGSVPILYAAVDLGTPDGRVAAVGRDQRHVAALYQRLMDAQGALERDYARLRHAEARYRQLFQASAEPVVIFDAAGQKVLEANGAAERLCGAKGGMGHAAFLEAFEGGDHAAVQAALSEARFTGRPANARVRLDRGPGARPSTSEVTVSVQPFRQDEGALLLVRLLDAAAGAAGSPAAKPPLLALAEGMPDGFVVTEGDGRIVSANAAFLRMAQLGGEDDARGEPLDRWLGRPGVEFGVLSAHLRARGAVRLFAVTLHGEHGTDVEAEVSAAPVSAAGEAGGDRFGFVVRDVGVRRAAVRAPAGPALPRPVEQLSELVGRVPLKELVREATDVIERLAIEAALDLTNDNRASAAEMLGLSRQSLYVKLRRYGLGGPDVAAEA